MSVYNTLVQPKQLLSGRNNQILIQAKLIKKFNMEWKGMRQAS